MQRMRNIFSKVNLRLKSSSFLFLFLLPVTFNIGTSDNSILVHPPPQDLIWMCNWFKKLN